MLFYRRLSKNVNSAWLRYVRVFAIANPSSVCLSSVTFACLTHGVETFGNISSPFCTLAILWPLCKILRRSSEGNRSPGDVKRKRGSELERQWTYRRVYLIPMLRSGLSSDAFLVYRPIPILLQINTRTASFLKKFIVSENSLGFLFEANTACQ